MKIVVLSICIMLGIVGCSTQQPIVNPPMPNANANTLIKVEFFAVQPPPPVIQTFNVSWKYSDLKNISNVIFNILGSTDFTNWNIIGQAQNVMNLTFTTTNSYQFFRVTATPR